MTDIIVESDLWMNRIYPEGLVESWLVPDGSTVTAGQPVAVVQIEGAPVTLASPCPAYYRSTHPRITRWSRAQ